MEQSRSDLEPSCPNQGGLSGKWSPLNASPNRKWLVSLCFPPNGPMILGQGLDIMVGEHTKRIKWSKTLLLQSRRTVDMSDKWSLFTGTLLQIHIFNQKSRFAIYYMYNIHILHDIRTLYSKHTKNCWASEAPWQESHLIHFDKFLKKIFFYYI